MHEERAILTAIRNRPDDETTKLVYADWLEERGYSRAEFPRLRVQVGQEQGVTPEPRRLRFVGG